MAKLTCERKSNVTSVRVEFFWLWNWAVWQCYQLYLFLKLKICKVKIGKIVSNFHSKFWNWVNLKMVTHFTKSWRYWKITFIFSFQKWRRVRCWVSKRSFRQIIYLMGSFHGKKKEKIHEDFSTGQSFLLWFSSRKRMALWSDVSPSCWVFFLLHGKHDMAVCNSALKSFFSFFPVKLLQNLKVIFRRCYYWRWSRNFFTFFFLVSFF